MSSVDTETEADLSAQKERYLKTAFLERVAHELRGPAGVIQGALQELEFALGREGEAHRHLFAMARRGVQRVVRTADRLQQTGQCERGTVPLLAGRSDVAALLRKSVAEAEALEGRSKITISVEVPAEAVFCNVDPRWMNIALNELASNAIRHARARVEVELTRHADGFQISFRDDCSSTQSFAPMRFLPPREARGLGLALAIVRDVVEAHGGTLTIAVARATNENPCTEVRISLPSASEPALETDI
jgi:signal transduction histidine kinase